MGGTVPFSQPLMINEPIFFHNIGLKEISFLSGNVRIFFQFKKKITSKYMEPNPYLEEIDIRNTALSITNRE